MKIRCLTHPLPAGSDGEVVEDDKDHEDGLSPTRTEGAAEGSSEGATKKRKPSGSEKEGSSRNAKGNKFIAMF